MSLEEMGPQVGPKEQKGGCRQWDGGAGGGYTDMPTWICPGDWDQILRLSKATSKTFK